MGWFEEDGTPIDRFKSVPAGAPMSRWAATSPQPDGHGGVSCGDGDVADVIAPDEPDGRVRGVAPYAIDPGAARRLWALSAELTGENAFAAV